MSTLTVDHVHEAMRALREKGVRFPIRYPPANLNPGSAQFRGVWAEVEVLALLCRVVKPTLLELKERDTGRDTDIIIHTSPAYRLQVKGPLAVNVRADYAISSMVRTARQDALRRFRAEQKTHWKGLFSTIRIHPGQKTEVYSGTSYSVDYPSRVHVAIVQIDHEVLAPVAKRNIEGWIRESVSQLVGYNDALLVPVLNVSRYSLDQARAYKYVKEIFVRHPRWKEKVSGVLLALPGYGDADPVTGLHARTLRLVGVENPLAPDGRRLNPGLFNPHIEDEEVFEENMVVISVEPPVEPWRIENGLIWVGGTLFGPSPRQLGEPIVVVSP